MIVGYSRTFGGVTPLTVTPTDSDVSSADQTTYTFTSKSIGTAAAGRRVLVAIMWHDNGLDQGDITSVTIGGTPATVLHSTHGQGTQAQCAFAILQADAGTTATIAVTGSSNWAQDLAIQVYAVYGMSSSTAHDSADDVVQNGTATRSASIDVPAGGAVFGCLSTRDTGTLNSDFVAWSLSNEDADSNSGGFLEYSAAHQIFGSAQAGLTVQAAMSPGPSNSSAMAVVSLGP